MQLIWQSWKTIVYRSFQFAMDSGQLIIKSWWYTMNILGTVDFDNSTELYLGEK